MNKDFSLKIQEMLVEVWNEFNEYYNNLAREYARLWGISNKKDAEESHWICWNEYDLMFHIGRLFYRILDSKKEKQYSRIQIHFEKNVNISNFRGYSFENKLKNLKDKLDMKRGPKIDMIIARENKNDSFLLCAELKYFHGRPYESPTEQISRDIEKLKALKELGIADKVVFMLLDDYYFLKKNKKISNDIENKLDEVNKDEIKVLFSNTQAKLHGFE